MVHFVTDFADQAVVLPLVIAIAWAVSAQGWRRGAAAWLLVVSATLAVILGLKLTFLACWQSFGTTAIHSPSGHVAAATIIAGGLSALLMQRRLAVTVIAVLTAGIIGVSRIVLGAHSLPEVLLGALVGLLGSWSLIWLAGRPVVRLRASPLAWAAIIILIIFHGWHFPAEAHIRATAFRVAHLMAVCR